MDNNDIKNLIIRFISAILFIPIIIIPILLKGYALYVCYIFLLSLMIGELSKMIKKAKTKSYLYLYFLVCILTIFFFIISISSIENLTLTVMEIIFTIWIFDTFCYLGGKIFNGKKLMPNISKGKTFNGLFSGIIATLIISFIYCLEFYNNLNMLFILTFPVIILSFVGDLIVSVLKRSINIKDSGYIIPGHGGIIDRMDSFVFVFFFFGIYLFIFA